jgi:pyruvate dehydrogenase E2 component (dihydrolipoamide acetyltransferase)
VAQMIEVLLPDIGDFHDVEVIEILVNPGDRVEAEDPLITLESDKASMEIPSPQAGVVGEVRVALGDKINRGDLLLMLETVAEAAAPAASEREPEVAELVEDAPAPTPEPEGRPTAEMPAEAEVREVRLPDIGDFKDVEIIELLVSVGDSVET